MGAGASHCTLTVTETFGGLGGRGVEHTAAPTPELHCPTTASNFAVPKHGSPNVVVLGQITHDDRPVQIDLTIADAFAASQLPRDHPPQVLVVDGVPYDTKDSDAITSPAGQLSVIAVLAIGGAPPLSHVPQKLPAASAPRAMVSNTTDLRRAISSHCYTQCVVEA